MRRERYFEMLIVRVWDSRVLMISRTVCTSVETVSALSWNSKRIECDVEV
jgi:hypothetical protein